jgi:hypothetical protein
MTRLNIYLERLENTLRSRQELMVLTLLSRLFNGIGNFRAQVRFYEASVLTIREELEEFVHSHRIERTKYVFHYQSADGALIFRYDNSPHYPDLPTFPSHKHTADGVIAAEAPDLAAVLREIDGILYPAL